MKRGDAAPESQNRIATIAAAMLSLYLNAMSGSAPTRSPSAKGTVSNAKRLRSNVLRQNRDHQRLTVPTEDAKLYGRENRRPNPDA